MDWPIALDTVPAAQAATPPTDGVRGQYGAGDPTQNIYPTEWTSYSAQSVTAEIMAVQDGCGIVADEANLGQMWAGLKGYFAPQISPTFQTSLVASYGPDDDYTYHLQIDGTAAWSYVNTSGATVVLFAIGSTGPYAHAPLTVYANINAEYDIVLNGNLGTGLGISQGGPANNNFQWTGDLTSGYNPAYSKTNGVYIANVVNAYATAGACGYWGTGVDGGPIHVFTGNGTQGIIGSISTNTGQTGVLFNTTSDRRLKSDIAPLAAADAATRLGKLVPSTFVMRGDPSQKVVTGFIADEFEAAYPEATTGKAGATTTNDRGETLIIPQQIDKTATIPDLVRMVLALWDRVAELEATATAKKAQ